MQFFVWFQKLLRGWAFYHYCFGHETFSHFVSFLSFYITSYRKKTATAVAFAKQGRGLIKVNGQPIENIQPEGMRLKVFEPVLILGQDKFSNLDIRIRVKGGGITAQIYAIRAAIAKSIVAYHAKYVDEQSKNDLRKTLVEYDRSLLVSDPRRCEPKKYGGRSARARFQKSYR
mmetsp:Transcript_16465/g.40147  ORF Transcript_16465/g.40147 Transcript_16465/m.40147 type:complete len:173 (-) Transcript_16465:349-867(-)